MNISDFDFNRAALPGKIGAICDIYTECVSENIPLIKQFTERVLCALLEKDKGYMIFEAGCAFGYSSCFMKLCAPKAKIITCDTDGARVEKARENLIKVGFSRDIKVLYGDAAEVMRSFEAETFDFVFIDAAKGQYPEYFKLCGKILKSGGTAVFDNAGFWGMVTGGEKLVKRKRTIVKRMKELLPSVLESSLFDSRYCPEGDGVLICQKR